MDDPDEMSAVLALGILAGMLALLQFWGQSSKGIFSGILSYPSWGAIEQALLFLFSLGGFSFYLFLMILAVGLERVGKASPKTDRVRVWARREFLVSWGILLTFGGFVLVRLAFGNL